MYKIIVSALLIAALYSCQNASELKSEQYFAEGYQLYKTYCANCHQEDGKGMSNLYPPLTDPTILKNKIRLACLIKNGMKGAITVDGKAFNRPMPANPKMKDIEIAEIISYVSMKWGKDSIYTSTEQVQKSLADCKSY